MKNSMSVSEAVVGLMSFVPELDSLNYKEWCNTKNRITEYVEKLIEENKKRV